MTGSAARRSLALAGAGGLQLAAWAWIRGLGDLSLHVHDLWWGLLPVLAGYAVGAVVVVRGGDLPRAGLVIALVAVAARLLLLGTAPSLSDDIYRYLWDGRVQAAGGNPYAQAPADAALADLRDDDWTRINHPELVTVYPPLAQWFFRGVHAVAPGVTGMKAALVVCDLLLLAVLRAWLRARGQDPRRVVLYAWHPLPVLEIAGNGHVDVLGVLCLCLALLCLRRARPHLAAAALAAAVLAKLIPLLCLGAFWRRLAPARAPRLWWPRLDPRPRRALAWVPVLCVAAWIPFADAGASMWSGLAAYASRWRFNDSAYGLVYAVLADPLPGWEWDDGALRTARWLCLAGVAAVAVWTALRAEDDADLACAAVLGAQLLLAPTVHPWYLLWILPFLALRAAPAWMAFGCLAPLAYDVLVGYRETGVWRESGAVRLAEYLPVYALLAASWLRRRRARNGPPAGTSAG